ncbi:hypothetical protein TIFTF001_004515 [Ficus carica]|uniref:Secreted protein n=1 Tax=Ficus carica TaxID=3494 RepID=A0AA87ZIT1_FICCA|nr:hypothetical protein TIFTF001_004515 [Ficus carica]
METPIVFTRLNLVGSFLVFVRLSARSVPLSIHVAASDEIHQYVAEILHLVPVSGPCLRYIQCK